MPKLNLNQPSPFKTESDEVAFLKKHGYDPSFTSVVGDKVITFPYEVQRSKPTPFADLDLEKPVGFGEAVGRAALRTAVPTVAAIGAGAMTGGLASIPVGIGTAMATSYLQERLFPASEREVQAREDQPLASFLGDVVPAAATLRPSLSGIRAARDVIQDLPTAFRTGQAIVTPQQKAKIAEMGLSAGVEGSVEAGAQALIEGEVDPMRVAGASAFGSLFTGGIRGFKQIEPPKFEGGGFGIEPPDRPIDAGPSGPPDIMETPKDQRPLQPSEIDRMKDKMANTLGPSKEVSDRIEAAGKPTVTEVKPGDPDYIGGVRILDSEGRVINVDPHLTTPKQEADVKVISDTALPKGKSKSKGAKAAENAAAELPLLKRELQAAIDRGDAGEALAIEERIDELTQVAASRKAKSKAVVKKAFDEVKNDKKQATEKAAKKAVGLEDDAPKPEAKAKAKTKPKAKPEAKAKEAAAKVPFEAAVSRYNELGAKTEPSIEEAAIIQDLMERPLPGSNTKVGDVYIKMQLAGQTGDKATYDQAATLLKNAGLKFEAPEFIPPTEPTPELPVAPVKKEAAKAAEMQEELLSPKVDKPVSPKKGVKTEAETKPKPKKRAAKVKAPAPEPPPEGFIGDLQRAGVVDSSGEVRLKLKGKALNDTFKAIEDHADTPNIISAIKRAIADPNFKLKEGFIPHDSNFFKTLAADDLIVKNEDGSMNFSLMGDTTEERAQEILETLIAGADKDKRFQQASLLSELGPSNNPNVNALRKFLSQPGFPSVGASMLKDKQVKDVIDAFARKRGVNVTARSAGTEGPAGVADLRERVARINPDAAGFGVDTPFHEIAHVFVRDLQDNGTNFEKNLVEQGVRVFGSEEALVNQLGLATANRKLVKTHDDAHLNSFLSNFWGYVKARFGRATDDELMRMLERNLLDSRDYADSHLFYNRLKEAGLIKTAFNESEEQKLKATDPSTPIPPNLQTTPRNTNPGEFTDHFIMNSLVNSARKVDGEVGFTLHERARVETRFQGQFVNEFQLEFRRIRAKKDELNRVAQYRYDKYYYGESDINLTDKENKINDLMTRQITLIRDVQNREGLEVYDPKTDSYRKGGYDKDYFPAMLKGEIASAIREGTPDGAKAAEEILDFWKQRYEQFNGKPADADTIKEFETRLQNIAIALGSKQRVERQDLFKALRFAQGYGYPKSVIDLDGASVVSRYGNRAAVDLSNFMTIQRNHSVRSKLDWPDQHGDKSENDKSLNISGREAIAKWENYMEHRRRADTVWRGANRAIVASWLGPVSGIRDIVSSYVSALPYMKMRDLPVILQGMAETKNVWAESFRAGVNTYNINDLMLGNTETNKYSGLFHKMADFMAKWQGRAFLERISRGNTFAMGGILGQKMFARAKAGDTQALKWIRKFHPDSTSVLEGDTLKKEDLYEMAAGFTERVQGTYDERGLPSAFLVGEFQPWFSLSRWSWEKANVIYSDIFEPLFKMKSDPDASKLAFKQLMFYGTGSVLGGQAIQMITDEVYNRKSSRKDLRDLKSPFAGPEDVAMAFASLAQTAGFTGFALDIAMTSLNAAKGMESQPVTFPLAEVLGNAFNTHGPNFLEAIDEGMPLHEAILRLTGELGTDIIQVARIAEGHLRYNELTEQMDNARELKVFRSMAEDDIETVRDPFNKNARFNPMLRPNLRNFKNTSELSRAAELLPAAMREAQASRPNEAEMINLLRTMQISDIPSPETDPAEFEGFMKHITAKFGPEKAEELARQLLVRRAANVDKRGMIFDALQAQ